MILFVLGFIAASSGWGPLLALGLQGRPDYSVCGQDMCACLPPTPAEPACPLCLTKDDDAPSCAESSKQTPSPKRVPRNDRFDTMSDASQAMCMSLFLSLVLSHRGSAALTSEAAAAFRIDQHRVPRDPLRDIPLPPPRA